MPAHEPIAAVNPVSILAIVPIIFAALAYVGWVVRP
jgi:hypothetical protein